MIWIAVILGMTVVMILTMLIAFGVVFHNMERQMEQAYPACEASFLKQEQQVEALLQAADSHACSDELTAVVTQIASLSEQFHAVTRDKQSVTAFHGSLYLLMRKGIRLSRQDTSGNSIFLSEHAKQYETLAAQTESYMYLVRRYDVLLQMFPSNLVARLLKKKCLGVWKNEK